MPNRPIFDRRNGQYITESVNGYADPGTAESTESAVSDQLSRLFSIQASNSASLGILGGSVNVSVRIDNPANSGRTLYLKKIIGNTSISLSLLSSFSGQVTALSGGTLTSPSTVVPANLHLGSSVTSVAATTSSTSAVSGGTTFVLYPLFPGGFGIDFNGSVNVPPGQTLSANVVGSLSVLGVLGTAIEVIWWEI
ncbi:hypothetical protein [Paenibacillus sp. NEAU-GSW1]|uniref:hypothetical protein n=1 Tax=Paenibacillus sp. NEAU-GSW1 TaxID=2682486 RepID=UPI0012E0D50B|nr:hypothetical protein [Paenibacillus sp. NEAU-GSW1]MUT65144.1 hypothetical protein [Paenibacillus sp. NEAU-GSW1]